MNFFPFKQLSKYSIYISIFFLSVASSIAQPLETVIQMGHIAEINAVKLSPDGKLFLTGSKDRTLKLWNVETGAEIRTFSGHLATVTNVAFNKKGNLVTASCVDGNVRIWDVYSGKEIFALKIDEEVVTDVNFFQEDFILTGGYQDSVSLINFRNGAVKKVAAADADIGGGNGVSVEISPDEKLVAIGEDNRSVSLYDADTWKLKWRYVTTDGSSCGGCGTVSAFSPDLKFLAKASENTNVKILELSTGKVLADLGEDQDEIRGLEFSRDGKTLLILSEKQAFVADVETWNIRNEFEYDSEKIKNGIYNSEATEIITGSSENLLTIYAASDGKVKRKIKGIANDPANNDSKYDINSYWYAHIARYISLKNPVLLLNDDKQYLKGKGSVAIKTWDIRSGEPKTSFTGHTAQVLSLDRYGRDTIASGDVDGNVYIWDLKTGKTLHSFKWYREAVFEVAFSSDGKKLIATSWDGGMYIYDLVTGERTGKPLEQNSVYSACFSPDNLYIVVSKIGKSLEMIEPESNTTVRSFSGHTDIVSKVRYLKNGKQIVSTSWDGTIRIWDISTGLMTKRYKPGNGGIYDFVIKGNDEVIITAGADRTIRIINLQSGEIIKELAGHKTEISTLRLNKSGTMLISQSVDGMIKFWDLQKYKELFEHIHIGRDDWMVRVPSGYFNGTSGALNKVNFVKGTETFSPDQFFEKFYRPDILKNALGTNSTLQNELEKSPLNIAKIALQPIEDGKRAIVRVKIYENGGGLDEIKLLHNGKRLDISATNQAKKTDKSQGQEYADTLSLVAGKNVFTVSSFNKSRFESKPAEAEFFSNIVEKSATCHLFVIGINKYKSKSLALNYARDDAESFALKISESSVGLFSNIKVHELYDEYATRQNILDTLEKLSHKIHLHDVFIFFYAGHGSINENNFFLIPTECTRAYDENVLNNSAISAGVLQEKLKKVKALKQIIILDACHSGGSVEMLATRGSLEERAISQLARSAGIHVLASAGSEQTAKEIAELKHGIFTFVMLKALSGAADGSPSDGKITVYELKSYLDDQVPLLNEQYSGKAQYPYTFSRGQDFPVVIGK